MNHDAIERILKAVNEIVDAGNEEYARGAVGMLIDMVSARYGGDPVEFADAVAAAVRDVNGAIGAYKDMPKGLFA